MVFLLDGGIGQPVHRGLGHQAGAFPKDGFIQAEAGMMGPIFLSVDGARRAAHQNEIAAGTLLEEECSQMMKSFFKELRKKKKIVHCASNSDSQTLP